MVISTFRVRIVTHELFSEYNVFLFSSLNKHILNRELKTAYTLYAITHLVERPPLKATAATVCLKPPHAWPLQTVYSTQQVNMRVSSTSQWDRRQLSFWRSLPLKTYLPKPGHIWTGWLRSCGFDGTVGTKHNGHNCKHIIHSADTAGLLTVELLFIYKCSKNSCVNSHVCYSPHVLHLLLFS